MTFPKDEDYYAEIKRYTRLLKSFPGNAHVLEARAACQASHSDWKRAARDYGELAVTLPNNAEIHDKLGQVCIHAGLYEQAITACTRAIKLDPKNPLPYMHRALAYRKMKQWDASAADYTKAISCPATPLGFYALLYRGQLYMEMGEWEKAVKDFSRSSGTMFGIWLVKACLKMKMYEKVVEETSRYIGSYDCQYQLFIKQRAFAYNKLGQEKNAKADLAFFGRLTKMKQKSEEKNRKEYVIRKAKMWRWSEESKKRNEATVQRCTAAIQAGRKGAKTLCMRGNSYFALGYYVEALQDLDAALSLDPKLVEAYYTRAVIYQMLGDTEKEIANRKMLPELCPHEPWRYNKLGALYEKIGRYEEALEFHTWYLLNVDSLISSGYSLGPCYKPMIRKLTARLRRHPQNAALYCIRGKAYSRDSQPEKAIADYTRAIALQPDLLIAYVYRAVAHKDSDKKTADLLEALKLNDKLSILHYMLGKEYEKAGKNELAIESFTRALKIAPEWHEIYRDRYETYAAIGEYQAAIDDLSCYIDHEPSKYMAVGWLTSRGDLYCKIGEYGKALEDYGKAIQYEKRYGGDFFWITPHILQQRGKCYEALHEEEKAQADFKKVAKLVSVS